MKPGEEVIEMGGTSTYDQTGDSADWSDSDVADWNGRD